ncbi:MAG: MFS transporter [Dehalobacterium sp.]
MFYGFYVAAGCLIYMFVCYGILGTGGVLFPELVRKTGITIQDITFCITVTSLLWFLLTNFVQKIINSIGAKWCMIIGSLCFAINFFVNGRAMTLTHFLIGSAFGGIGMALGTTAPISLILTKWFIKKRASVITFTFMGMGFGAAAFIPLSGYLLAKYGVRGCQDILAIILLIICIPTALFLIKDDPAKKGLKPYGADEQHATKVAAQASNVITGVDAKTARNSTSYWLLLVGILLSGIPMTVFKNYVTTFWQMTGMSPMASANWLGLVSFLGAIGLIFAGQLADKFGTRFYLIYVFAAYAAGTALLLFSKGTASSGILVAIIILIGLAYAMSTTTPTLTTMTAFGRKDYGALFGAFQSALPLGSALTPFIVKAIMQYSSLYTAFVASIIIAVVAFILIILGLQVSPLKKVTAKDKSISA